MRKLDKFLLVSTILCLITTVVETIILITLINRTTAICSAIMKMAITFAPLLDRCL